MNTVGQPIVKTKLSPPRISGTPQRRDALLSSLHEQRDKRLTLIVGPAGCGKSTLAAIWRQRLVASGRSVCWYNIHSDDADIGQFVSYLVAALQTLGEHIGESALAVFNRSGGRAIDLFVGELVNDLCNISDPFHLFLEDLHTVADSAVPQLVDRLLDAAPACLRMVVTSRTRTALNVMRFRVLDDLNELGFADLQFSLQESISFLRTQGLTQLGPAELHRLHRLSDGWAAGLQLLAYSIRKARDPHAYVKRLQGSLSPEKEASLTEYMSQVIDPILTSTELDFLVRSSACRRFTGELCELLTGNPQSRELLERFEAENLFVIAIDCDDERPWYRFHKTFAKFLTDRLLRMPGDELARINRLASQWFAEQGLQVEAIRHSAYAGDSAALVELTEQSARSMLGAVQFLQLLKWFRQIPRHVAATRLELLLCVAWANIACGFREEFEWCVDSVAKLPASAAPPVAFELVLLRALALLRRDDTAVAWTLLQPYVTDPPSASRFALHLLYLLSSMALAAADEFERTRDLARSCRLRLYQNSAHPNTPILDAGVGLSFLLQGDVRQAKSVLSQAIRNTSLRERIDADPIAYLAGFLAESHYELDELDEAAALLAEYGPLIDLIGLPDSILSAHKVQSQLQILQGDLGGALLSVRQVQALGEEQALDRLVGWSLCEQIRLHIRNRELPTARDLLRQLESIAERHLQAVACAAAEIPLYLEAARIEMLLAQGDHAMALQRLIPLIARYEARGHALRVARLRSMQALSEHHLGEHAASAASLRSVLHLVSVYGFTRVLIDAGSGLIEPLEAMLAAKQMPAVEVETAKRCLEKLRRGSAATPALSTPQTGAGIGRRDRPADQLSAKEFEILQLLSNALSNKSIGRTLNISAGTVKWHLKNIYSKLAAVSREDALARARELRILD